MPEQIQQSILDNALVILTDRMPGLRSATLGFFYRIGSRNEPAELTGISHFIEHTVFKGTSRRSAFEISVEQDRLGGNLDAFTSHEETGFAIKFIDDQLEAAFDLLADMLIHPSFDEKELRNEQRVIIEEMKMTDDSPEELLGELFSKELFPNDALGRPIAGSPKSVKSFNRERTLSYHTENFCAGNLVIVAAGNVDHGQMLKLAEETIGARSRQFRESSSETRDPRAAAPIFIRQKPDLEQAHLILSTPIVGARDERRYAADLLTNIIGGGVSSRLWQKIREDRGLAYSVGASNSLYRDCGVFSIFAGTSPDTVGEVVDIAVAELGEVVRNGITDRELTLAKQQARAAVLLSLEDSAARAGALAQSEVVYRRQIPVDETLAKIEAVRTDDAVDLAREFFRTESIGFAALGDLTGLVVDRDRLAI